jgi:hypothetical protein
MFLVNSVPAKVYFDSGASHSFVTKTFVDKGKLKPTKMNRVMVVQISGSVARTKLSCKGIPVEIHGVSFQADLIILGT